MALQTKNYKLKTSKGFTLMEILVATSIFSVVVAAMMSLFNYTLLINRRSEALRQATQGMRNFVEFIAKEVRNGQVDYGLEDPGGTSLSTKYPLGPCSGPAGGVIGKDTYGAKDNKFAVLTPEGDLECFFLAYGYGNEAGNATGTPVGSGVFAAQAGVNSKPALAMKKSTNSGVAEILTPPNVSVQNLVFIVRPVCDPYSSCTSTTYTGYPKIQPSVTILAKFLVTLPTKEQSTIYYQTSVSSNRYDIPNQ